jgi:hypothetical protein
VAEASCANSASEIILSGSNTVVLCAGLSSTSNDVREGPAKSYLLYERGGCVDGYGLGIRESWRADGKLD